MEFAIALPLLILLMYGLGMVGIKIFELGKIQLADYVLEEEAHDVLSRIIYDARAAKSFTMYKYNLPTLSFTYRTTNEIETKAPGTSSIYGTASGDVIASNEEKRVYAYANSKIYYERQEKIFNNPITGNNYFGETEVTKFDFDEPEENLLYVTLEMESLISHHKIKINTAVYMPSLED